MVGALSGLTSSDRTDAPLAMASQLPQGHDLSDIYTALERKRHETKDELLALKRIERELVKVGDDLTATAPEMATSGSAVVPSGAPRPGPHRRRSQGRSGISVVAMDQPGRRTVVASVVATAAVVGVWLLAGRWPEQTQAAASFVVGIAIVLVTWRYTRHSEELVQATQTENEATRERHIHLLEAEEKRSRAACNAAVRAMASELRELKDYLELLKDGTLVPYPQFELISLPTYASYMSSLPDECNSAVLRVHHQLVAANVRAHEQGYWKRAGRLPERMTRAIV